MKLIPLKEFVESCQPSIAAAARFFRVERSTVYNWIKTGDYFVVEKKIGESLVEFRLMKDVKPIEPLKY